MIIAPWVQVVGLLVCTFRFSAGSVIVFQSTPTEIKDGLTGSVTLRCGLNDTAASAGVIGRRDVTRSSDNMEDVSSVIVMKGGHDVASVSHRHGARLVGGASNLHVVGDVAGASGERGFLELTYTAPSQGESGEYVCEINAVSESGHARVFSTSLEINISTPTVPDLVRYVRELETRHQNEINNHQNEINNQQNEINILKHVESGVMYCGGSSSWHSADPIPLYATTNKYSSGTVTRDIAVKFQDSYSTPPLVNIGTIQVDSDHTINLRYIGNVVSVDTHGFTFRCGTWDGSHIYMLGFSWLSVPQ